MSSEILLKRIPPLKKAYIEKFFKKINKTDNGCWNWIGYKHERGYGVISLGARGYYAHRVSMVIHNVKGSGLVLHGCNNTSCVNPDHLRFGTPKDNMQDKMLAGNHDKLKRNHCVNGHPYDAKNLMRNPNGYRRCRICSALACKKWKAKRKLKRSLQNEKTTN